MALPGRMIGSRELLEAYVESLRPQVHEVMADHKRRTLAAFEAALGARVPREYEDAPVKWRPLFMLFQSTVNSLLRQGSPMSGFLEATLILVRLEEAGTDGSGVLDNLRRAEDASDALKDAELAMLEGLFRIFLGSSLPAVSMEVVRATGLYPGDAPKDFDIFDYM